MSELRWILIVFGVVLLAGVYFWGRRSSRQSSEPEENRMQLRPEPQLATHEAALHDRLPPPSYEEEETDEDEPAMQRGAVDAEPERPAPAATDSRRGRVEPTFSELEPMESDLEEPAVDSAVTEELPAREPQAAAPTLSMSETPAPRRIERRKIIALRLAASSDRFSGQQLRQTLEAERLEHGKYDVFHRLHEDGVSIFSVASMVEPGTFDLEKMQGLSYPGVTLFAQLPGPVVGVQALHDLVACGKRLQEALGGTLQDDRGVPLTVHRIDRLRQEIVEFERAPGREAAHRSPVSPPAH
ncbi:MAG TPA: cell division protein ZipA C-terminal FtsZ-binding domain-containing protein [Povalibacter sp.]|nr:cell division protein ZipA C-terminal FtsZ-binding domain-containing protein [Povalibacter sp.]